MHLWLLESACDDTSTRLTPIHEFKSFPYQADFFKQQRSMLTDLQKGHIATRYMQLKLMLLNSNNKDACSAALEENTNAQVFVPSSGTRHRHVRSRQAWGTFVQKKRKKKKSSVKKIAI